MRKREVCARLKIWCSKLNTKVSHSSTPVINSSWTEVMISFQRYGKDTGLWSSASFSATVYIIVWTVSPINCHLNQIIQIRSEVLSNLWHFTVAIQLVCGYLLSAVNTSCQLIHSRLITIKSIEVDNAAPFLKLKVNGKCLGYYHLTLCIYFLCLGSQLHQTVLCQKSLWRTLLLYNLFLLHFILNNPAF